MHSYRPKLSMLVFSIFYWTLCAFYFVTLRYSSLAGSDTPGLQEGKLMGYAAVVGFSVGVLFGIFPQNLLFKKRKTFLLLVLAGTSCYIFFFMTVIFFTSWYGNSLSFAAGYLFSRDGLTALFHLSMSSLFFHFLLQVNKKFGPGILLEYTLGKYFTPQEEERVFMFIDLRSSTSLAEKLDNLTYSRMIQDCYAALTAPLLQYKAQVYQYVGDEVVVSWKMHSSFNAASCYDFFFAFRQQLDSREHYFKQQYGVCPRFKAGIHCGRVTVAEVGEIKTEIAYHGDVLNTAARIQALCNSFQEDLLVSGDFLQRMPAQAHYQVQFLSDTKLRGKETPTAVYAVNLEPYTTVPDSPVIPLIAHR